MKNYFRFFLFFILLINEGTTSLRNVESILERKGASPHYYPEIAKELIKGELYFTALPFVKELLITRRRSDLKKIDQLVDEIIVNVGVGQFEVLPEKVLKRSRAPVIYYILSKKYFRLGHYKKSLEILNGTIPKEHPAKPFALLLEGSALSLLGKNKTAMEAFKECVVVSESFFNNAENKNRMRQIQINRDYCLIGLARMEFTERNYISAGKIYSSLPKKSYVWPEILFEEAWNSFYERNYNRTLGKLVSYNAPILNYYFNPEIDVLKALTFLELCLYKDSRKTVDSFYKKYEQASLGLKELINKHGKDYKYYYLLSKSSLAGKVRGNILIDKALRAITRDPRFREMKDNFLNGKREIRNLKSVTNPVMAKLLRGNLKDSLLVQRNLIGAYVLKQLRVYHFQTKQAFENMSYINLDILDKEKRIAYSDGGISSSKKRGDIKNLIRKPNQYFWSFDKEFWADELGDYVFSLKSACRR